MSKLKFHCRLAAETNNNKAPYEKIREKILAGKIGGQQGLSQSLSD
jgi:hypothetical protein